MQDNYFDMQDIYVDMQVTNFLRKYLMKLNHLITPVSDITDIR